MSEHNQPQPLHADLPPPMTPAAEALARAGAGSDGVGGARLDPLDVEAIARRVAQLVAPRIDIGWVTAEQLAERLAVRPGWVYRHARALGGVKLGDAANAPWRFDLAQALTRLTRPASPRRAPAPSDVAGAVPDSAIASRRPTGNCCAADRAGDRQA